ncbi:MAG: ATP-binding cassette domain-containing protein [Phycisphaerales bacterium]
MISLSGTVPLPTAVRGTLKVSLRVATGELKVLLGANGCGKSTVLDTIAGARFPLRDVIRSQGPYGYAVQDAATGLLPWLTVRENVGAPVQLRAQTGVSIEEPACPDADWLLAELAIAHLSDRLPHRLSGGERQLVNIARALHTPGCRLLLDEPFANLGRASRERACRILARVRYHCAILLVTHLPEDLEVLPTGAYVIRAGVCEDVDLPSARDFMGGGRP